MATIKHVRVDGLTGGTYRAEIDDDGRTGTLTLQIEDAPKTDEPSTIRCWGWKKSVQITGIIETDLDAKIRVYSFDMLPDTE